MTQITRLQITKWHLWFPIPTRSSVVSKRFGQGATNIDRYLELDGYKAVQKALAMQPDAIINEVKNSQPPRTRRRRLHHRDEVVVRAQAVGQAEIRSRATATRASRAPARIA